MQGRERIVRHLGLGGRYGADQGGLASIGQSEQPHIRHDLELEPQIPLFTGQTRHGLARGPVRTALELSVAPAALPAFHDQKALALFGHIAKLFFGFRVDDDRTDRHRNVEIGSTGSGAVTTRACRSILGLEGAMEAEVGERIHTWRADQIDICALPAVAPIRPAEGDELLATKAHGAAAAVAGLNFDDCFVDETHGSG